MPMELLAFLEGCSLPVGVTDFNDIERAVLLRDIGLIEAEIPRRVWEDRGCVYPGGAIVSRLTPTARKLAQRRGTCSSDSRAAAGAL